MRFLTHILSPNNTGSPNYNICGQATSIVDHTNMTVKFNLSDGTTTQNIFTTTNLSLGGTANFGTYTFGDLDIAFTALYFDPVTGSVYFDADFFKTGTTDVCTWGKIFLTLEVSKSGYQTYTNIVEIYGYDIGNDVTLGISGNTSFDIHLINNTNNVVNGLQTKTFSKFAVLRQPFTNAVYFYNLVATQGVIQWLDVNSNLITTGKWGQINVPLNNSYSNAVTLQQKIQVMDNGGTIMDTCTSSFTDTTKIWKPIISTTNSTPDSCVDGINNISTTTISVITDYTLVTPFNYDNVPQFPAQYLTQNIAYNLYDFQGSLIASQPVNAYVIDYASWLSNPATYLVPIQFTIIAPPLGDITAVIEGSFSTNTDLSDKSISLEIEINFDVCNWWKVTKGEVCSSYVFNNCSLAAVEIVLQKLNDDKVFEDILTVEVDPASTLNLELSADGVYVIKVPSRDTVGAFDYYSITNFCAIEACFLAKIQDAICSTPKDDCQVQDHYAFNVFVINMHAFMMLLNEEYNFSFMYSTIDTTRLDALYTLSSFITRMSEYCDPASDTCVPCSS